MHCISINHKLTPVKIRELFAFSREEAIEFGNSVLNQKGIKGIVIVSTCNRSEIYFSGENTTIERMEGLLCEYKNISFSDYMKYFLVFSNHSAVKHLFRVTSGLDSMVIGEDEILRQIKEAYQTALDHKFTSHEINIAFQGSISCAKAIKTDTQISNIPISIGTLTANCVEDFLKIQKGCNILIVGITGSMGSIVAKNLSDKENIHIVGTSRTHNAASKIFSTHRNIKVIEYKNRYAYLSESDVIISATTSPHYTFTFKEVQNLLNDHKQRLFIDLAVPSDIDRNIKNLDNCEVYNIDYFTDASKKNNVAKMKELDKVESILESMLDDTLKNIFLQKFVPTLNQITTQVEQKGFQHLIFKLKDKLSSDQLSTLLTALDEIEKGE